MKYTELHAHIEGNVPIETIAKLIAKYPIALGTTLPEYFTSYQKEIIFQSNKLIEHGNSEFELINYLRTAIELQKPTETLLEFLKRIPSKFLKYYMRSADDVKQVIESTFAQYGDDYSRIELIFIPNSLENEFLSGDQLVEIFSDTWKSMLHREKYGFVLSMRRTQRDVSPEYAQKVVQDYGKYIDVGIEKLDICADEDAVSYKDLTKTLDILQTARQQLTLHIGESTNRDLSFVLDNYPTVKQFNHGIQAAFSRELVSKIKRNNILLTLCPLSNVYTGVLTEEKVIEAITIFKDNEVRYTISSDDATIINGDVRAPYKYLELKYPELLPN